MSFLRELRASSVENVGFAANQFLLLWFLAGTTVGMLSANNYAMKIGLLVFSLVGYPLAQLIQAKACSSAVEVNDRTFLRWFGFAALSVTAMAVVLLYLRIPILQIVYLRGKFSNSELTAVAGLLPAWVGYFVVMSLNGIAARYLFARGRGSAYARNMLIAYLTTNLFRLVISPHVEPVYLVWCAVVIEAVACLVSVGQLWCEGNGDTFFYARNMLIAYLTTNLFRLVISPHVEPVYLVWCAVVIEAVACLVSVGQLWCEGNGDTFFAASSAASEDLA